MFNEMTFNCIGHIGDAEVRSRNSSGKVSTLSIATNDRWKGEDGQVQERTNWFRITSFSNTVAKLVEDGALSKGRYILARGDVRENRWTDKDGNEHFDVEFVARRIDFLQPKPSDA